MRQVLLILLLLCIQPNALQSKDRDQIDMSLVAAIQPECPLMVSGIQIPAHKGRMERPCSTRQRSGLKAALDRYAELKTRFFRRGAYDFGERGLNVFGYEVLGKKDFPGAIQVFKMNAELFPNSANVWDSMGEAYIKAGNNTFGKAGIQSVTCTQS